MKKIYSTGIQFLLAVPTFAQLSLTIQMDQNPSPYIADWRSKPNTIRFVVSNASQTTLSVRFSAYVEGERRGRVAETKSDAGVPPVMIPPGTTILNGIDAHFLEEGAVRFIGSASVETQRSGRLPEDNFRLCVQLKEYENPAKALSPEACTIFKILLIQPPSLISPSDKGLVIIPPAFQWSPVQLGIGMFAQYELTLVELDPGQENPAAAMQTNLPLIQRVVTLPVYQYQQSDPKLTGGKKYAWRVRAFDPAEKYSFANSGLSVVWSFTFGETQPYVYTPKSDVKPKLDILPIKPGHTVQSPLFMNCTIQGNIYYTFDKGSLLPESKVEQPIVHGFGNSTISKLKPLAGVTLRLVKRYKILGTASAGFTNASECMDMATSKKYDLSSKIIYTGTSGPEGQFTLPFIDGEPTIILKKANFTLIGGETSMITNATLFKYYQIEVVNPYYCSSDHEIAVEPGSTVNVMLSSLVRTYDLRVRVLDADDTKPLGNRVNVYLSRPLASTPLFVPTDEGELSETGTNPPFPAMPISKYSSMKMGMVLSAKATEVNTTKDYPETGSLIFRRLVRSVGTPQDKYLIHGMTPEIKPDGGKNFLFYHEGSISFQRVTQQDSKGAGSQQGIFVDDAFSSKTVSNRNFTIMEFTVDLKLNPKKPMISGIVTRSDNKNFAVAGAKVELRVPMSNDFMKLFMKDPPKSVFTFTDAKGYYEIPHLYVTGATWSYTLVVTKNGYQKHQEKITTSMGQKIWKTVELSPLLVVTRAVVDEQGKPIEGVKVVLGNGKETTTNAKGHFSTPAITGKQILHLEKLPTYATKDTQMVIPNNPTGELLGALFGEKIVMFEPHRRLALHIVDEAKKPIPGAVVTLDDKYEGPPICGGSKSESVKHIPNPWRKVTDQTGTVAFVYDSPTILAHVSVCVPSSDFVPRHQYLIIGVVESGMWVHRTITLKSGGRIAGVVGIKTKKTSKDSSPPMVQNARVAVEGYPYIQAFTDEKGAYELRGVPKGKQTIKAARSAKSVEEQTIGASKEMDVAGYHQLNLYLTAYLDMDITKIYGFPITIESLKEMSSNSIQVNGSFIDTPDNSIFSLSKLPAEQYLEFHNVVLSPGNSSGQQVPPVIPNAGSVSVLNPSVSVKAFNTKVDMSKIVAEPLTSDMQSGGLKGTHMINTGSLNVPSTEFSLPEMYLTLGDGSVNPAQVQFQSLLSQGGTFTLPDGLLHISNAQGKPAAFAVYGYNGSAPVATSYLYANGIHLDATVFANIPQCGSSSCIIPLKIGEILIADKLTLPPPSSMPPQDIPLQKWTLQAQKFGMSNSYYTFDGLVKPKLVPNAPGEDASLTIPFTGLELRPNNLTGGSFPSSDIDLLGIATLKLSSPFTIGLDANGWNLATDDVTVPCGGLEGLKTSDAFKFSTFRLRAKDNTNELIPKPGNPVNVYDVSEAAPMSFNFGYDTAPYLEMQANLKLLNIPNLSDQFSSIFWKKGGKFGMYPVKFQNYPAGKGVLLNVAGGFLGTMGFLAEGVWGNYGNFIVMENGNVKLSTSFRHQKKSTGFSTIAEIINSDFKSIYYDDSHKASPIKQALYGNTGGIDVLNVFGRTQLEPGQQWSTKFSGWYSTTELAGKDSLRFVVNGGNGAIEADNATMKMKGTKGGLGYVDFKEASFPKGPVPEPPTSDESPFTSMTLTPDFPNKRLIGKTGEFSKEISPNVSITASIEMAIGFSGEAYWYFFGAGSGKIPNPPCSGSAVFLAGLNYKVTQEQKALIKKLSLSKRDLPSEYNNLTGFFTQVAATMPIPGTPNFDLDVGLAHIAVHCMMGGEGRVGMNFYGGTNLFFSLYARAWAEASASASVSIVGIGASAKGASTATVDIYGKAQYDSNTGCSVDFAGSFNAKGLTVSACVDPPGMSEVCADFTPFEFGGGVKGKIGAGSHLDFDIYMKFLGL